MTRGILRRILLRSGVFRGLNSLDITFEYPITAIAGKNGAGKSTILALACCAFHNADDGFKLPRRRNSYYTFSDFFIQNSAETSPRASRYISHLPITNGKKVQPFPTGLEWQDRLEKNKRRKME
ncbi:AAA family ATPase [Variovorax sp. S12S4]|uniref:AAA family ATPase n=1 Tax=Variovorax sp. S12S4 TaxID=3029170 RepID=UPI00406CC58B